MEKHADVTMGNSERSNTPVIHFGDIVAIFCIGVLALCVYMATMAPGLTWSHRGSDGAEFVVAAVNKQVPHPPGFPLYLMISRLLAMGSYGNVPLRLNALSACMAIGTLCLTGLGLVLRGISRWSMIAASLCLGFAPLYWSQAVITEVYTTAAFFLAATSLFMIISMRTSAGIIPLGILWGLSIAVHPLVAVFTPYFWYGQKKIWNGIMAGVLTVALCYASLPLLGTGLQKWADLHSFPGWLSYISAHMYWNYPMGISLEDIPNRSRSLMTILSQQFTPVGAVIVTIGITEMWVKSKGAVVPWLIGLGTLLIYAITYNSGDSFVYLVLGMPILILALAEGMDWIRKKGCPGFVLFIIPVILVGFNWHEISLKDDSAPYEWLMTTLDTLPPDVIILSSEDKYTFTLWYADEVVALRNDISIVDTRLWQYPFYREYIAEQLGWLPESIQDIEETRETCHLKGGEVVCK
ncbi:MAG: DUF2723 domain-containing protein [Anaerolineae bacterium]|nr:DUF2723 domain-containing protein [Anaerolineae bacterium]